MDGRLDGGRAGGREVGMKRGMGNPCEILRPLSDLPHPYYYHTCCRKLSILKGQGCKAVSWKVPEGVPRGGAESILLRKIYYSVY